ncbi:MAG: LysM peptidoglycan-binding domain-containing M23 family metallopeptidase [Candidatus Omnitrophica bacterium]|nr:LysM peptidoglycan-binding domain-containing M23 family metallopeptidase [Candidatus Omnitrophota bacterium]
MKKTCFTFLFIAAMALSVSGCATVGAKRDYLVSGFHPQGAYGPEKGRAGVYHKVKRGETLWRIAKAYDVTMDDIIDSNRIPNVARVEENQLVFIPGVHDTKEIISGKEERENGFAWPVRGKLIGYFHERKGAYFNKGIDIQPQEGSIVRAARRGQVVFADYLVGYGYMVILDHADELYSVYARNERLLVRLNDPVHQGQEIARLGRMENAPYLHFEIRKRALEDNPLYYLP